MIRPRLEDAFRIGQEHPLRAQLDFELVDGIEEGAPIVARKRLLDRGHIGRHRGQAFGGGAEGVTAGFEIIPNGRLSGRQLAIDRGGRGGIGDLPDDQEGGTQGGRDREGRQPEDPKPEGRQAPH